MVDTQGLGPCVPKGRGGSIPLSGTNIKLSDFSPTNSAAQRAASYGKMGFPRAKRDNQSAFRSKNVRAEPRGGSVSFKVGSREVYNYSTKLDFVIF